MCGIYGGYWGNTVEPPVDRLAESRRLLHHRGPDDSGLESLSFAGGILSLGHTRLSIIDLTPGGHQPMCSADGRYQVIFNGEIYNYRELRRELRTLGHDFHTDSDTEVLLKSWAQWGKESLRRFVGMFSFALFDSHRGTLSLARDAFGIKPLFYAHTSDSVIFASELPALLALRSEEPQINAQRSYEYLIHQVQDRGSDTFIQGVHHVPPAHCLQLDLRAPSRIEVERWWNPSVARTSSLSFVDAAEQLRELFLDSVRLHLRSDVPLGVALSGGIDSSAIACSIRFLEPNIELHTFSYIGEHGSQSEEPWIDIVNEKIGAIPHKVYIDPDDLGRDLDDLIRTQGEPFGGTAMYAQWRVFQSAQKAGMKVILEGQGGDEILGGYYGYPGSVMLSYLESLDWRGLWSFAKHYHEWEGRESLNPWRALFGLLLPGGLYKLGSRIVGRDPIPKWINKQGIFSLGVDIRPLRGGKKWSNRRRRLVEALHESLTQQGLPHLLRYGDRNAMRFSVENRVPFLTLQIAEFMFGLPEEYLVSKKGEAKSLFREAMRGIVPDDILDRRDKVGFDTPGREWMKHRILNDLSAKSDYGKVLTEVISRRAMMRYVREDFETSEAFNWEIWRIFNLLVWAERSKLTSSNGKCS
mgnify:CR=1 FL=1